MQVDFPGGMVGFRLEAYSQPSLAVAGMLVTAGRHGVSKNEKPGFIPPLRP